MNNLASVAIRIPSVERAREIARVLPLTPHGPGEMITNRRAWARAADVPEIQALTEAAAAHKELPPAELSAELFLRYFEQEDAQAYAAPYWERIDRLGEFAVAECVEDRGTYLPAISRYFDAILSEPTWIPPAHDLEKIAFEGRGAFVELCGAMRAMALVTADHWLGDRLPLETRTRLRAHVRCRILDPYRRTVETGATTGGIWTAKGMWWIDCNNNWNAVCHLGVVLCALATLDPPEERAWFVAAAEHYLPIFLSGYGRDGYCTEGLGYWDYGFGHFLLAAEVVREATAGKVNWFAMPQVATAARFPARLQLHPACYPAFADCDINARPSAKTLSIIARRIGIHIPVKVRKYSGPAKGSLIYGIAIRSFLDGEDNVQAATQQPEPLPLRDYFEEGGVLLVRDAIGYHPNFAAALKGGHNEETHNHNDVGSFVVAAGGVAVLVDPGGPPQYDTRSFGPHRYESSVNNSYGHPVPMVGGELQKEGREREAKILKLETSSTEDRFELDLARCYELVTLRRLVREFLFERGEAAALTVTDRASFSEPTTFSTALLTYGTWVDLGNGALQISSEGQTLEIAITGHGGTLAPIRGEQLKDGRRPTRLHIGFAEPVREGKIRMAIRRAL